jgi:hypothetical protein
MATTLMMMMMTVTKMMLLITIIEFVYNIYIDNSDISSIANCYGLDGPAI